MGVVEAAFAGVLGVQLGGTNTYEGVAEDRGTLGGDRLVGVVDIAPRAGSACWSGSSRPGWPRPP